MLKSYYKALATLHWLCVPERITYKIAVLSYKVLHGSAPRYLRPLVPVSDQPGRRTLRSADTSRLLVPPVKLSTVGSRAFLVAGPRVWNALPEEITSSSSQMIFCRRLKAWLFRKSFPDIIIWLTLTLLTFLFCFANLEVALLHRYSDDDDDDDDDDPEVDSSWVHQILHLYVERFFFSPGHFDYVSSTIGGLFPVVGGLSFTIVSDNVSVRDIITSYIM